ncbi:MAG: SBBP repeat-containing protein [Chloroflexi bacterium]|nr:SBBP repeat-containing protein [Chloroflexota bacterium]
MKLTRTCVRASSRTTRLYLIVVLVANLLVFPSPAASADYAPSAAPTASPLSFTAGGHVLGFQPDAVLIASGGHLLKVDFERASRVSPVSDRPLSNGHSNADRLGLRDRVGLTSALPLGKVSYPNLWPGITLAYESLPGGIAKSTYFLEPGARVEDIRLLYNVPVELASDGTLVFAFETGEMRESAPVAWQEIEGERVPVEVAFRLLGERGVGFGVGPYDADYPLAVDPDLVWNSFVGGSGNDYGYAMALDDVGNAYITGDSSASWGSPVRSYSAGDDVFVAKLDSSGNLLWNTFLGGSGTDGARSIAIDGSGNVYVGGYAGASWGSPVRGFTSNPDGFAAKLDTNGSLQWNTFLGGSGSDYIFAIAGASGGNVHVGGRSDASWGSPVRGYTGGNDALVAMLDSNGSLQWSTFLGGSGSDYVSGGIVVDGSGNTYISGQSNAAWGSPVRGYTGGVDGLVAKLDSNGSLQWHTFLGGSGTEDAYRIARDGNGNLYVGGQSNASWGSPVRSYTSDRDALIVKLDGSGNLLWHTFLGGSGTDYAIAIAVEASGNSYIGGASTATWGSPVRAHSSGYDAFAARLDANGGLIWNTFLGTSGTDEGYGIGVDDSANVYVGGYSNATWGSPLRSYTASEDALVAKLSNTGTYADPAGACGGNIPCLTSISLALGGLLTGGTAFLYGGTYTQSLSISTNVTATLTATVAITGSVSLTTGTLNTNGYTLTVSGDWTNTGGAYTANNGRVIFDKSGTATLSKSGAGSTETFCNLTVSRTTTVLDVSDDYLAIADGCSLTNNGAIRREAPAQNATNNTRLSYNDPLGYPTVALTSTGGTALGSTAITVTIGQTPPSCNGSAFAGTPVKRHYQVTPASTSGVSGTLRLYYPPGEANGTTASNVNLFHCGSSGGWMQVSGTAVRGTDENANKYVEVAGVTTFSPFTLGEGSPTGVEVSSLAASALPSGIEVGWETASELNVTGFDLWRAEGSGGEWLRVNEARIAAEGASWGNRYSFLDSTAVPGRRYGYRLEAVRLLGGSEWYGPVWGVRGWNVFLPMIWR